MASTEPSDATRKELTSVLMSLTALTDSTSPIFRPVTQVSASQVSLEQGCEPAPSFGSRLRSHPRQNSIVHCCRPLDVQEMSGIRDYLHPRRGREVTLGIPDEREIDAAIAIPVQV